MQVQQHTTSPLPLHLLPLLQSLVCPNTLTASLSQTHTSTFHISHFTSARYAQDAAQLHTTHTHTHDYGCLKLTSTESRFSRVTKLLVRSSTVLPMCCSSHTIGAPAAWNICLTASAISGPMPSPGNSVAGSSMVMIMWLLCRSDGRAGEAGAARVGLLAGQGLRLAC